MAIPRPHHHLEWKRGLEIKDQTLEGLGQTISVSLFSSSAQGSEMPVVEYGQAIVLKSLKVTAFSPSQAATDFVEGINLGKKDSPDWIRR
jgi:hypothetical protein